MSQNERIHESLQEIYLMSEASIAELMVAVVDYLPLLYRISDSLALLDMIISFAVHAFERGYGYFKVIQCDQNLQTLWPYKMLDILYWKPSWTMLLPIIAIPTIPADFKF
jgi:hypothetical protein